MKSDLTEYISDEDRADFDGLWKDAIEYYFPQLIERTMPDLYVDVDFSRGHESLSQELRDSIQRPIGDEHNPPLFVDELIKVYLKDGSEKWILLHIEVQGSGGADISYRMMLYCCLIFAHHRKMPVGLAILTQRRPKDEVVGSYELEQYGSRISYKYNCLKVYDLDDDKLLNSDNPFDLIFYAVKKTIGLSGKSREQKKFSYLRQLLRLLDAKGWDREKRRDILNFIARAVHMKDKELEQQFFQEAEKTEGGSTMKLSFIEEHFLNEGKEQGIAIGEKRGIAIGKEQGIAIGKEQGKLEANFETARRMRAMGMVDIQIQQATNLSFDEISRL